MNDYTRSLLRFWWVLLIGLAVAVAAAVTAVYNVDFSTGHADADRAQQPSYSAQGRLLVTDQSARISGSRSRTCRRSPPTQKAHRASFRSRPRPTRHAGAAANLYPSLIESDQVAEIRESIFGPNDGEIKAQALHAISSPSRFAPSRFR